MTTKLAGGTVTVCNLTEQRWVVSLPYGRYEIRGKQADEPYALSEVRPGRQMRDTGLGSLEPMEVGAEGAARDVVQDLEDYGVFICAGDGPSEQEIAEERERMERFYRRQIENADADWNHNPDHRIISDVARRAANYFGFERPWAGLVEKLQACEFCGAAVRIGVAKCRECGAILDAEKALKGNLISQEQYQAMRGAEPPSRRETPKLRPSGGLR